MAKIIVRPGIACLLLLLFCSPAAFAETYGILSIATGSAHTVALKSDGTVTAWGDNALGQTAVPAGLIRVTAIAAGYNHTVALKSDGTVIAWGSDSNGQITVPGAATGVIAIAAGGNQTVALKAGGSVVVWGDAATVPDGLSGVIAVAAGGNHTVALISGGTVTAWGDNTYGQAAPQAATGIIAIAAGGNHTVALKSDGIVIAWGSTSNGQITIPGSATGVIAIAAGGNHTVSLKSDGTVVAWGDNSNGQRTVPVSLSGGGVIAIAAGGLHTVALISGGTVTAWGNNTFGQTTVPFSDSSGVKAISAGWNHAAALKSDGSVVTWGVTTGIDAYGQTDPLRSPSSGIIAIAAGGDHNLALKSDGTVTAWGRNTETQLDVPAGLTGVIAIAAGSFHSVALKSNGSVVAWGDASGGAIAVPGEASSGIVAVAAGDAHNVALKSDGTVIAWGYNDYSQSTVPAGLTGVIAIAAGSNHSVALMSNGTVTAWGQSTAIISSQLNVPPVGLTGVKDIAAGDTHTLALMSNGTVTAWGNNGDGQSTVPVGLSGVVAIAARTFYSMALKSDGSLVAWGRNDDGQTTIPYHTVTVSPSGNVGTSGAVVITGNVSGLNCTWNGLAASGVCTSGNIIRSTRVTLYATLQNTRIVSWLGCDSTTATTCTINSLASNITTTLITADNALTTVDAFTVITPSLSRIISISTFSASCSSSSSIASYMVTTLSSPAPLAGDVGWGTKPTTYTVSADGTYTLYPWAKSLAGAVSAAFGSPRTVLVDTVKPTAAITYSTPGPYRNGTLVTITATFSEPMADAPVPKITIAGVNNLVAVDMTKSSTTVYTYINTITSGNGTATIALSTGTDLAGNEVTAAPTSGATFTVDSTPPTAVITYSPAGPYKTGAAVTITATFNEPMADAPVPQIAITGVNTLGAVNMTKSSTTVYNYAHTVTSGDGAATVALSIGTDLAGNVVTTAPTSGTTFTVDSTPPTLTPVHIQSNNANPALAKTSNIITLTFTSSEAVSMPTVTIAGHAITPTGGTTSWTAAYTLASGDTEGTVLFSIAFSDLAGNPGVFVTGTTDATSITFDKTVPTLTPVHIQSNNANPALAKTGNNITLTFTSSEAVSSPTVTIAGHAITPTGGSTSWSAAYTLASGDTEGTVLFSIAFSDLTGNPGVAVTGTTDATSIIFDKTVPTLTPVHIQSNNANTALAKTGNIITLTFTSSEAVSTPTVTIAEHAITPTGGSTSWSAAYTMSSGDTEGTVLFSIAFSDLTGNPGVTVTGTNDVSSVVFDRTAPLLLISAPSVTNAKTGMSVIYTVTYTGADLVTLPTGSVILSKTNTANGTVEVTGSDTATRTVTISSLTGNGTLGLSIPANTASDIAGNTALSSGPSATFTVDNLAPTLVISEPSVLYARSGTSVTYTVTYAGADSITLVSANVILNGSGFGVNGAVEVTGSGTAARTVTISSLTGDGSMGISLPLNTASDLAGNQAPGAGPSAAFEVDNIQPTVTITSASTYTTSVPQIPVTVIFSEPVINFISSKVSVGNGSIQSFTGSGDTYSFVVTPTINGTVTVNIPANIAQDMAGNPNVAAVALTRVFDSVNPATTISADTVSDPTNTSSIPVTVHFTKPVSGFTINGVSVSNGNKGAFTGTGTDYSFVVLPISNGTVTVSIAANVAYDAPINGNGNTAAVSLTRIYDIIAPTLSISAPSVNIATSSDSVTYTVTYSGADFVSLSPGDVTPTNGSALGTGTIEVSGAGNSTKIVKILNPSGNGTLGISIKLNTASDLAGNQATSAGPSTTFTVDNTPPTVLISSTTANTTNVSPIPMTVNFSKPVTGFTGGVTAANGIVGSISGSGQDYTFSVTPVSNGTVTVSVAANAGYDSAGNGNIVATPLSRIYDNVAPTLAIGTPSATIAKSGASVTYTVTYSSADAITLADGNVTMSVTGDASGTVAVSGSGLTTRTVTIASLTGNGTLGISIAAGTASDLAGNSAAASGVSSIFTVDNTLPTIAVSAPSASVAKAGATVIYTVTYSSADAVTLANADVTLNASGAGGVVSVSGTGTTSRTITISSLTGNGTLGISIAAGTASDMAGNLTAASSASATFTVDNTLPTMAISLPSVIIAKTGASVTYTVTYNSADAITLADGNVTMSVTGDASGTVAVSGSGLTTRTVTISSLSGNGTLGISIAAGTASDLAGNSAAATGASSTFTVDNTLPTLAISGPSPAAILRSTGTVTYTVTYSGADSITLANSNVTLNTTGGASGTLAVSGSGLTTRTVTISNPSGNGTLGISIAEGTASDQAGNAALSSVPSATFAVNSSAGDLNGDNTVDTLDALEALRIAVGIFTPTAAELIRGDVAPLVNGVPHPDEKIDISDVVVVLKMAVGSL